MENPSFLYAIAGVSMSMAGFAGLVAVLRRADADRAQHLFRIGTILWHCLGATFFALFPVALYAIWPDAAGVLRLSSALVAAFALERFWRSLQSRRFYPASVGLIAVGASLRTVDSAIALVNVVVGSLGLYELALLLLLGMPASAFGVLFTSASTRRPNRKPDHRPGASALQPPASSRDVTRLYRLPNNCWSQADRGGDYRGSVCSHGTPSTGQCSADVGPFSDARSGRSGA